MKAIAAWLSALLLLAGCVVGALDYAGKRCTGSCPDGLACVRGICGGDEEPRDATTQDCTAGCAAGLSCVQDTCVAPAPSQIGAPCTETCPMGLTCVDAACRQVATSVWISGLHAEWGTPNAIRWAWTVQGIGADLQGYEIAITSNDPSAPSTRVWTKSELAELGSYQLKHADGFEVVGGTITYDLAPQTSYTARVTVKDAQHTFVSEPVLGSTDAPRTQRLVVSNDGSSPPGSYLVPMAPAFGVSDDAGVDGGKALSYRYAADPEQASYQNLRVSKLGLSFDATLTEHLFETAYLEVWIRGHGMPTSTWSEMWLRIQGADAGACSANACLWSYSGKWVYHPDLVDAVYRRVQLPLSAFVGHGGAATQLTWRDAATSTLLEVNMLGTEFLDAANGAELDRVALFW